MKSNFYFYFCINVIILFHSTCCYHFLVNKKGISSRDLRVFSYNVDSDEVLDISNENDARINENIDKQINITSNEISIDRRSSAWWPWKKSLKIPEYLDGTLAGDLGFDPLGLAVDKTNLFTLREAEYRHARLAMLAAVGWPASELVHYRLSKSLGMPNLLAENFRAPSVLNGGLNNANVLITLGLFLLVGSILEIELEKKKAIERENPIELQNFLNMWREDGWDIPGNYGFDPLKLGKYMTNDDKDLKFILQTVEIFNGRVAMLAITGYVVQEYLTGLPVITETPEFFKPFYEIELMNILIS